MHLDTATDQCANLCQLFKTLVEPNPMVLAILIDQLQKGKVASLSRNIVHVFVLRLSLPQAQQYLVPLKKKNNLLIEVKQMIFREGRNQKSIKLNKKKFFKRNYLNDFVLELLILFIFIKMVWLISANWCLTKIWSLTQLTVHKCTLIYGIAVL